VAIGGGMFQKLGLVEPYPTEDKGRAKVTGRKDDEYVFKAPSLRNVAKTGPWFHDGGVETLDMAVRVMARFQLGKTLTDAEVGSIAAFLNALTGEIPKDYVVAPPLPASGPETPKPDPS
jgi:cytochrome c peroxidase